jgi:antitoxin HicB
MLRASISCRKKLQSKMFDKHKNHESHSSKSTKRMHTSRAALNRLLDENDASLTLTTLASAAAALGKKVNLQLVAA